MSRELFPPTLPTLLQSRSLQASNSRADYAPVASEECQVQADVEETVRQRELSATNYLLEESVLLLWRQFDPRGTTCSFDGESSLPIHVSSNDAARTSSQWSMVSLLTMSTCCFVLFGPLLSLYILKLAVCRSDSKRPNAYRLILVGTAICFCLSSAHLVYLHIWLYGWSWMKALVLENRLAGFEIMTVCLFPFCIACICVSYVHEGHMISLIKEEAIYEAQDLSYNSFDTIRLSDLQRHLFQQLPETMEFISFGFSIIPFHSMLFLDAGLGHTECARRTRVSRTSRASLHSLHVFSKLDLDVNIDMWPFRAPPWIIYLIRIVSVCVAICPAALEGRMQMFGTSLMHKGTYSTLIDTLYNHKRGLLLTRMISVSGVLCLFQFSNGLLNFALGAFFRFAKSCIELLFILYLSSSRKGRRSMMWVQRWTLLQCLRVCAVRNANSSNLLAKVDEARADLDENRKVFRSWMEELRKSRLPLDDKCKRVIKEQRQSVANDVIEQIGDNDFYSLDIDKFFCIRQWQLFDLRIAKIRLQNLSAMAIGMICFSLLAFHIDLEMWGTITGSSFVLILAILFCTTVLLGAIYFVATMNTILIDATVAMLMEWKDVTMKAGAVLQASVGSIPFVSRTRMAIDGQYNGLLDSLNYSIQHIEKYERPICLLGCAFTRVGINAAMYTMLGALATLLFQTVMRYETKVAVLVLEFFRSQPKEL